MKIILVNPLWSKSGILPTNLAELAGYIRAHGHRDIQILDLNYELSSGQNNNLFIDRSIEIIEKRKPDILGISCNTIHVPFVAELCKKFKKKHNAPIVLGGIHPTFRTEEMFSLTKADYIVRGEGEKTFLELLDAIMKGKDVSSIAGLSYNIDKVCHNPDRALIKDLSLLPFPAYDLLLPYSSVENVIYISAGRGCPFGCHFCSAHRMWRYQRRKTVKQVIEEIRYLKVKFSSHRFGFTDDCLTLNKKWLFKLTGELEKLDVRWNCYSRIDTVEEQIIEHMKRAGCFKIYHGIESGSSRLRKLLGKKLKSSMTNDMILKIVEMEQNSGLKVVCSCMTGIPTETREEMQQTIDLALLLKGMGAKVQFWIMTPYPDTEAVRIFSDKLIRLDRWYKLKQADVFFSDQYYFYKSFIKKYQQENPDFFMFKPDIPLKEFFALYMEGREKLRG